MDTDRSETLKQSIINIAQEAFRFKNVFQNILNTKIDPFERRRYFSQFSWFFKKVEEALETAGMKIVDLTGEPYDIGMAVTPLNIADFNTDDHLYIDQMVTPVIIENDKVVNMGTVILEKVIK